MPENSLESLPEFLKLGHHLTNPLNPTVICTRQKVKQVTGASTTSLSSVQSQLFHWSAATSGTQQVTNTALKNRRAAFCCYQKRNNKCSLRRRLIQFADNLSLVAFLHCCHLHNWKSCDIVTPVKRKWNKNPQGHNCFTANTFHSVCHQITLLHEERIKREECSLVKTNQLYQYKMLEQAKVY